MVDIHVIAIENVRHEWIDNPDHVATRVEELASARGHNVILVQDLQTLTELFQNPPNSAVIMNAHGEVFPMPEQFQGDWIRFLIDLGRRVIKGWTWVSITGYPFFYYAPAVGKIPDPWMAGLATFLSSHPNNVAVAPVNPVEQRTLEYRPTPEATQALERLNIHFDFPMRAERAFHWNNVTPIPFLTTGGTLGACAIPMGRGYFVHSGIISSNLGLNAVNEESDHRIAELALAFTLAMCETDLEQAFNSSRDDEDQFREYVVKPLLQRMGFRGVQTRHPREYGQDLVFYEQDGFGEQRYCAAQVSVKRIHKDVRKGEGYAGVISKQAQEALVHPYTSEEGQEHWIHESYVFTSKEITQDAQELIRDSVIDRRGLVHFFDGGRILELIHSHR